MGGDTISLYWGMLNYLFENFIQCILLSFTPSFKCSHTSSFPTPTQFCVLPQSSLIYPATILKGVRPPTGVQLNGIPISHKPVLVTVILSEKLVFMIAVYRAEGEALYHLLPAHVPVPGIVQNTKLTPVRTYNMS